MSLYDRGRNAEPDSQALRLGADERLEDLRLAARRQADAAVGHGHLNGRVFNRGPNRDLPQGGGRSVHRFHCIAQEIDEDLLNLHSVHLDRWRSGGERSFHGHLGPPQFRRDEPQGFFHNLLDAARGVRRFGSQYSSRIWSMTCGRLVSAMNHSISNLAITLSFGGDPLS